METGTCKIVLLGPMPSAGRAILERQFSNIQSSIVSFSGLAEAKVNLHEFSDADVIVGGPIDRDIAGCCSRLRLFHVFRGGTDGLGLELLNNRVKIANTYHHEASVAEFTVMSMLMLPRNVCRSEVLLRKGCWTASGKICGRVPDFDELTEKRVLIIGVGRIAMEIAKRLKPFGVKLFGISRTLARALPDFERIDDYGHIHTALHKADYVILSCRLNGETERLISEKEFHAMRSSSYLINVARAGIVDEKALFTALSEHMISGAAVDVWYRYPSAPEKDICFPSVFPFHSLDNIIMSPEISSWTRNMLENRMEDVGDNIMRLITGKPLCNIIKGA